MRATNSHSPTFHVFVRALLFGKIKRYSQNDAIDCNCQVASSKSSTLQSSKPTHDAITYVTPHDGTKSILSPDCYLYIRFLVLFTVLVVLHILFRDISRPRDRLCL